MGWQRLHLMVKMLLLKTLWLKAPKIFDTFVKLSLRPETTQNERPKACWSHRPVSLCKDGSSTLLQNTFHIRPFISLKCKPPHTCNSLRLCGNMSE